LSKIGVTSRDRLRGCYGLAPGPVKAHEPGWMLGLVENIVAMPGAVHEFNGVSHVRSGKAE
jgi:hypothetical protein